MKRRNKKKAYKFRITEKPKITKSPPPSAPPDDYIERMEKLAVGEGAIKRYPLSNNVRKICKITFFI